MASVNRQHAASTVSVSSLSLRNPKRGILMLIDGLDQPTLGIAKVHLESLEFIGQLCMIARRFNGGGDRHADPDNTGNAPGRLWDSSRRRNRRHLFDQPIDFFLPLLNILAEQVNFVANISHKISRSERPPHISHIIIKYPLALRVCCHNFASLQKRIKAQSVVGRLDPGISPEAQALMAGMKTIAWMALAIAAIGSAPGVADARECRHTPSWEEAEYFFQRVPVGWTGYCYFRSADKLLGRDDHAAYRDMLANGDCRRARSLVSAAFRQTYPEMQRYMPCFFSEKSESITVLRWFMIEDEVYPEISVCMSVDSFFVAYADIGGTSAGSIEILDEPKSYELDRTGAADPAGSIALSRKFHHFLSHVSRASGGNARIRFVRFALDQMERFDLVPRLVDPHMPLFLLMRAGRNTPRPADFASLVDRAKKIAGRDAGFVATEALRMEWDVYHRAKRATATRASDIR